MEEICEKSRDIVEAYVDSYWDTDEEYHKRISGWIIFVNGSALTWGSRGKLSSVTLISTTASMLLLLKYVRKYSM